LNLAGADSAFRISLVDERRQIASGVKHDAPLFAVASRQKSGLVGAVKKSRYISMYITL
jgi:hypothetical protein